MSDKKISRCTGCGEWVYGITLCGMCKFAQNQLEKQKQRKNCTHENLTITFLKNPIVICFNCNSSSDFDLELNPIANVQELRNLLEGVKNAKEN